jgi:hypothetical protein
VLVAQCTVEITRARVVISREISCARERMRRNDRLPAEGASIAHGAIEIIASTEWTRWCHQCDACASREGWWHASRCNRHARRSRRSRLSAEEKRAISNS